MGHRSGARCAIGFLGTIQRRRGAERTGTAVAAGGGCAIAAAVSAMALGAFSAPALATNYTWNSALNDSWQLDTAWTPVGVPTSNDNATVNGGTILVDRTVGINQLLLTGSSKINVQGNGTFGSASLLADLILLNGRISLDSIDGAFSAAISTTNELSIGSLGQVDLNDGHGGDRGISGSVFNAGTVNFNSTGALYVNGQFSNVGAVHLNGVGTLTVVNGNFVNMAGGTLTQSAGSGFVLYDSTFTYQGGTVSGRVELWESKLKISTADGKGATFAFTRMGGQLVSDVAANTSVLVIGNGTVGDVTLNVPSGITNRGTIQLDDQDGPFTSSLAVGSGTLVNAGTISIATDFGGARVLTGMFSNTGFIADGGTTTTLAGDFANSGTYLRLAGGPTYLPAGSTFHQNGGSLTLPSADAPFVVTGGAFILNGGAVSGEVELRDNSTLQFGTADGLGSKFQFTREGSQLIGDLPANTFVRVTGNGAVGPVDLSVAGGATNRGTITLEDTDGAFSTSLQVASGTFTNAGRINLARANSGARQLAGTFVNIGTIIDSGDATMLTGDFTNNGMYVRGTGGTTTILTGSTFHQTGQVLSIDPAGAFNVSGGTFSFGGGKITGNVDLYDAASLKTTTADGNGAVFNAFRNGTIDSDLSAGVFVNVIGNGQIGPVTEQVKDLATNYGSIILESRDGSFSAGLAVLNPASNDFTGTYFNRGTITAADPNLVGGGRTIAGNVANFGTISAAISLDVMGTLDDLAGGYVGISPGRTLTMHGSPFVLDGGTLFIGQGGSLAFADGGSYLPRHGVLDVESTFEEAAQPNLDAGDSVISSGQGALVTVDAGGLTVSGGVLNAQNGGAIVSAGAGNVVVLTGGKITASSGGKISTGAGSNIVAQGGLITLDGGSLAAVGKGVISSGGLLTGNGTFAAITFDVDSTSTVDATGGTLRLNGALSSYSAGTLNSGQWQVKTGSTLVTSGIGAITINKASITLDGAGSVWTNVNSLNNNQGSFTVSGGRAFTTAGVFASSGTLSVGAGSTFTSSGRLSLTGGSFGGSGAVVAPAGLTVSNSVHKTGSGPLTVSGTLIVSSGAQLDLDQSGLTLNYTGATPAAAIRTLLVSGFNSGNWNGTGIDSTSAHADGSSLTALGYVDSGSAIVVKYTYYGDSNLDSLVNSADFARFLDGLASGGSTWAQGDFTYDGRVDLGNDFNLFLTGYMSQGAALGELADVISSDSQLSGTQKAQLLSAVPEPALAGWAMGMAFAGRRRRGLRRKS